MTLKNTNYYLGLKLVQHDFAFLKYKIYISSKVFFFLINKFIQWNLRNTETVSKINGGIQIFFFSKQSYTETFLSKIML